MGFPIPEDMELSMHKSRKVSFMHCDAGIALRAGHETFPPPSILLGTASCMSHASTFTLFHHSALAAVIDQPCCF